MNCRIYSRKAKNQLIIHARQMRKAASALTLADTHIDDPWILNSEKSAHAKQDIELDLLENDIVLAFVEINMLTAGSSDNPVIDDVFFAQFDQQNKRCFFVLFHNMKPDAFGFQSRNVLQTPNTNGVGLSYKAEDILPPFKEWKDNWSQ